MEVDFRREVMIGLVSFLNGHGISSDLVADRDGALLINSYYADHDRLWNGVIALTVDGELRFDTMRIPLADPNSFDVIVATIKRLELPQIFPLKCR